MSMNKAIEYGKEHRKQFAGSKLYFKSCCNHGRCKWCESNRRYNEFRDNEKYEQYINEYLYGDNDDETRLLLS